MEDAVSALFTDPWVEVASARTGAGDELILRRRGERFEIRCNGAELMANRAHHSEEELARLALAGALAAAPVVLIGGLGMGYTLRAALDVLPDRADVTVAEALPEIVAWNRGPLAALAGRPLEDARVRVMVGDVGEMLRRSADLDAVILDVDNGPDALSLAANGQLYTLEGLALIRGALAPKGTLALWSSSRSASFERRLAGAGFDWRVVAVPARGMAGDPDHAIYLAGKAVNP